MSRANLIAGAILTATMATAVAGAMAQEPISPEQMKVVMQSAATGAKTWAAVCESCHGPPNPNTPARTDLLKMSADQIYTSLTVGKMKPMGDVISDPEKRAVSMYLTGKPLSAAMVAPPAAAPTPPSTEPSPPAAAHDHPAPPPATPPPTP